MNKTTLWFTALWITLALVADVIFALHGGEQATISWQVQSVIREFPVIPFAVGFIAGHLFWQIREPK